MPKKQTNKKTIARKKAEMNMKKAKKFMAYLESRKSLEEQE